MAVQFIGMRMLVSLREPPGSRLIGTVSDIKPGQSLSLQNGMASDSERRSQMR